MDVLSETQGEILNKSSKLFEISSQILSKLNQDPKTQFTGISSYINCRKCDQNDNKPGLGLH